MTRQVEGSKYNKIAQKYRDLIDSGVLRKGDQLPSTDAIVASEGVSRVVATKALDALRTEGYVHSKGGYYAGVYVLAGGTERLLNQLEGIVNDLESKGQDVQLLRRGGVPRIAVPDGAVVWDTENLCWKVELST